MKRLSLLVSVILVILLLVGLLWQLRSVVFMFILALAIAAALEAPTQGLARRGWPRGLALLAVYGGVLGGLLLLAALISTPTAREIDPLLQDLLNQYALWQQRFTETEGVRPVLMRRLPTTEQLMAWFAEREGATLAQGVLGFTQNTGYMVGQAALAGVISIYWSADQARFERLWLSLLPPKRRTRARHFWRRLQADVGAYIRSEMVQTLLTGGLLVLVGWLLGVKYPWMLAFLAALAWLIPLVGGLIAVVIAAAIGLLSGPLTALGIVVATTMILALMEFGVERWLYQHERYWGVLVVVVMLALGDVLGIFGLLIAPPVAVALQFAINDLLDRSAASTPNGSAPKAVNLHQLQARLEELRLHLPETLNSEANDSEVVNNDANNNDANNKESSARLQNLAGRLEQLIAEAERAAKAL